MGAKNVESSLTFRLVTGVGYSAENYLGPRDKRTDGSAPFAHFAGSAVNAEDRRRFPPDFPSRPTNRIDPSYTTDLQERFGHFLVAWSQMYGIVGIKRRVFFTNQSPRLF